MANNYSKSEKPGSIHSCVEQEVDGGMSRVSKGRKDFDNDHCTKAKDQGLEDGIFAGEPAKEPKQEKTDAKCDHQSASQRFNQSYRQRSDRERGFIG